MDADSIKTLEKLIDEARADRGKVEIDFSERTDRVYLRLLTKTPQLSAPSVNRGSPRRDYPEFETRQEVAVEL